MSNTLDTLRKLASASEIKYPYDDNTTEETTSKKKTKDPKIIRDLEKKDYGDSISDINDEIEFKLKKYGHLDNDDFDDLLDSIDFDDEDLELKHTLLGMGRKYARSNAASESENEIDKAFAANEEMLRTMINAIDKDALKIEKDLEVLRGSGYNRNPTKTADLTEAKTSMYSAKLSAIKELNNIAKTKFDLKSKADKAQGNDDSYVTNNIMQSIFGMDRGIILKGSDDSETETSKQEETESNDEAESIETGIEDNPVNDGDLYLKYEGHHVDMIAEYNVDTQQYSVYAEDENGEILDDYPVPSDIDQLTFSINYHNQTAVDQLQRQYKYRETGAYE